ncbi:MAG: enterochelin esterase [Bdellovibrionales bacterium]|nr:enterochelin esterase [Bdellovibrionales bacterium]
MAKFCMDSHKLPYNLKAFESCVLHFESQALKGNPLNDPVNRQNYLLIPKGRKSQWPIVFHLSGYFSTGYQSFDVKTLQKNIVQQIDELTEKGECPRAIHVFVEATTYWGGSQFINSHGCGQYGDYLYKELIKGVTTKLPVLSDQKFWAIMGASSGGYGALQWISQKQSPFGLAYVVSPDSYFDASLLPELLRSAPEIAKYKNFSQIKSLIASGEIQDKRSFFPLVNVIAMAHCYAPKTSFSKDFLMWPIDLYSGVVDKKIWGSWLLHDPIHFLLKRKAHLVGKEIHLDVGKYDEYHLQFGTRQIAALLKQLKVKHSYNEFSGAHRGLTGRRVQCLKGLSKKWRSYVG